MLSYPRLPHRCLGLLVLSALLVLVAGCGRKGSTVSGKVYYKGQPLTAGMVQFFPEGKGGDFSSSIKQDGSYSISKVPPGSVKITVTSNTTNPMPKLPPMAAKGMKKGGEMMKKSGGEGAVNPFETKQGVAVPPKYGNPDESGLKLDVTGGNQPYDIKID
jgi:hypothetical protein